MSCTVVLPFKARRRIIQLHAGRRCHLTCLVGAIDGRGDNSTMFQDLLWWISRLESSGLQRDFHRLDLIYKLRWALTTSATCHGRYDWPFYLKYCCPGVWCSPVQIRHSQSQVYDGSLRDTLSSIETKELHLPWMSEPAPPKIALIAGEDAPFRLSEANQMMPSLEQFVSQLDLLDAAINAPGKPDFLVMLCSPAMLHLSAVPQLLVAILSLLEHRLSVHVKVCNLQEHGLPQGRSILIIIASPFCAPLPWALQSPSVPSPRPSTTLRDLIVDLAFENPRAGLGQQRAFVCSQPLEMHHGDVQGESHLGHIYNHQTGQGLTFSGRIPLAWETDALVGLSCTPQPWTHPGK